MGSERQQQIANTDTYKRRINILLIPERLFRCVIDIQRIFEQRSLRLRINGSPGKKSGILKERHTGIGTSETVGTR